MIQGGRMRVAWNRPNRKAAGALFGPPPLGRISAQEKPPALFPAGGRPSQLPEVSLPGRRG
jgi:hypothetical protein